MSNLTEMLAIEHIRQLKARYFRAMDARQFDHLGDLFCEDALFDLTEGLGYRPVGGDWVGPRGPVIRGRLPIVEMIKTALRERTSTHYGHSHEVVLDGESDAHGVVAMEDYLRDLDRVTLRLHGAGHYYERYRVEDGVWRIAESRLERLFLLRSDA